jgi:hypothetical protein
MGMFRNICLVVLGTFLVGCTSALDTEESSIKYDNVDCAALRAQRDAIARQYPVLPPEEGERMAMGAFAPLRDAFERGSSDAAAKVARGRIRAMDDSMWRRQCPGATEPAK